MRIIDKKPSETPDNIFYGVNVNNKEDVEKEFKRLKKKHKNVTIMVIVVLCILAIISFDFLRVNYGNGKPIFAIEEKVERGTLFTGLGYKVLYCNNGNKYIGSVLYQTCSLSDEITLTNMVYEKFVNYAVSQKIIDNNKLKDINITELLIDESNSEGGTDYLITLDYTCKNNNDKCFKTKKEYDTNKNIKLYVCINKYNEVYDIKYFKMSGEYYKQLNMEYTDKVKNYLIENNKIKEENLRYFKVELTENHGRYKFRGTVYADSYLIGIDYLCKDNSSTCVEAFDKKDLEEDYANLSFYASMFVDLENEVSLVGPREYLDL